MENDKHGIVKLHDQETSKQALHEYKNKLQIAEAMKTELELEISLFQSEKNSLIKDFEMKISNLEQKYDTNKKYFVEKIEDLEKELLEKNVIVEKLLNELKLHTDKQNYPSETIPDKNTEKLQECRGRNEILMHENEILEQDVADLRKQCDLAQESNISLKNQIENLTESLEFNRNQVSETKNVIQELQDEMLCLKNELEVFKSKPLDEKSQGNSLFAEVNDRRLQLEKNAEIMKQKFNDMKREKANLVKEITSLRNKNGQLIQEQKENAKQLSYKLSEETTLHKITIQQLQEIIESYKRDEALVKPDNTQDSTHKQMILYEKLLETKEQEIKKLRNTMESKAIFLISINRDLMQTQGELMQWKYKTKELQNEVDILRQEISSGRNDEEVKSVDKIKEEKICNTRNENKENSTEAPNIKMQATEHKANDQSQSRRVQFEEKPLSVHSDNVTIRKVSGLQKTIHFTSVSKKK